MTGKVIQGSFLGGQPKLPSAPFRVPPPVQAKAAARPPGPPASTFTTRPPGAPAPAFASLVPGPPALAFAGRPGAVQRQGAGGAFAVEAGALGLAAAGGRALPEALRGKMEAALGADFAEVRVHVGPQAERIGAIAFTLGSDIYFAPGRYQPETLPGQQLVGHELAHVVQQRAGRVKNPLGSGIAVVQDHALEAEADRLGRHAAAYRVVTQAKMRTLAARPKLSPSVAPARQFWTKLQPKSRRAAIHPPQVYAQGVAIQPMFEVLEGAADYAPYLVGAMLGLAGLAYYRWSGGAAAPIGGPAPVVPAPVVPAPIVPAPVVPAPVVPAPVVPAPVVPIPGPYSGFNYAVGVTRTKLNQSEGRASPVTGAVGHPRQHVGKWEKAERYAEEQGRTKSVFRLAADQDEAVAAALMSPQGALALAVLDANPLVPTRQTFTAHNCNADILVVKAKRKTGAAAGDVKSWQYTNSVTDTVTVTVDSRGTGNAGDIHIQTAYPVAQG